VHNEVPVFSRPAAGSPRRGVLSDNAALPFFAFVRGAGCAGRWVSVGPLAWVCQDKAQLTEQLPVLASALSYHESSDGLPHRYFFVGREGSSGYARLRSVDVSTPDQAFERGFAVAIVEQREHQGELFGRTTHGMWLPVADLVPVRATTFHGQVVADGTLDFAWIVSHSPRVLPKPAAYGRVARTLVRFQVVAVLETVTKAGKAYYRIDEDAWVDARDARKPTVAPPPEPVLPGQRWVDIELATQTLVAYEGERPVYATLVSTGKGPQGTAFATPTGLHRIWVKLVASSMDNLEDEDASDYYSIEDVPYVQYFSRGVGLHAAFWHDQFGHAHSHGCVNLPPLDAQWLFQWTGPRLPAGWRAVFPAEIDPGTLVRVR
jgi:hypothetical protein